jgi:hypothetical protein
MTKTITNDLFRVPAGCLADFIRVGVKVRVRIKGWS